MLVSSHLCSDSNITLAQRAQSELEAWSLPVPQANTNIKTRAEIVRLCRLDELYTPKPWLYWINFMASCLLFYCSFVALSYASMPIWLTAITYVVSVLLFYRTSAFMHEIVHSGSKLRGLKTAYNVFFGGPMKTPLLVHTPHLEHNNKRIYGTTNDPEYEPWADRPPSALLAAIPLGLFFVAAWFIRFALLPFFLPFIGRQNRLRVYRHLSTFVMNLGYRRPDPFPEQAKDWSIQEALCAVSQLAWFALAFRDVVPAQSFLWWYAIAYGMFVLNFARAMGAHIYGSRLEPMDVEEQIRDSVSIPASDLCSELWSPLNIKYHSLHHLFPRIPYHNLPLAHKRLTALLPEDHFYRASLGTGLIRQLGVLTRIMKQRQKITF